MNITWEDRKNNGSIDGETITVKPTLSFEYAWFVVNDETAQYVESHDEGVYNKDLTQEQRDEIVLFYSDYVFNSSVPEYDPEVEKVVKSETPKVVDGKKYVDYVVVPLTDEELLGKVNSVAESKKDDIRLELDNSFNEPIEVLSLFWDAGFNSSLSIDGAARISENAGNTTVTIHDSDNKPQELTIADAIQVAAVIGADYQTKFALKQARMVQVDDVDKTAVDAIELIRAI